MIKLPFSTPSGTYIEAGPQSKQLYGCIPKSDALIAVLEINTDAPGHVFTFFMRGGFAESAMSMEELQRGAVALGELVETAKELWPRYAKVEA